MNLAEKLDQRRFTAMSDKMAALVVYIIDDESVMRVEPRIEKLVCTSDGLIIAVHRNLTQTIIGTAVDLVRNFGVLCAVADLTPDEADFVMSKVRAIAGKGLH